MPDETISIDDVQPDAANVRQRTERSSEAIRRSLQQFGAGRSIVMDAGGIVRAGNGTLAEAKAAGITRVRIIETDGDELVAVRRRDLSGPQAAAYAIADNRAAELSQWDEEGLDAMLLELTAAGTDLEDMGFTEEDLGDLFADLDEPDGESGGGHSDGTEEIDRADQLVEKWKTDAGQLWGIQGTVSHRLYCGDSTTEEAVLRAIGTDKATMVFTDPPYGVNVEGLKAKKHISGDLTQTAIPFSFELCCTVATHDDAWFYFCGGEGNIGLYAKLFERHLQRMPKHLIWVKNGFVMRANGYHGQYELIFCGFKKGSGARWCAGRTEHEASDVWHIDRDASANYQHPTQKPVALSTRAISNSSQPGEIVFDPFLGSGSTMVAAEQTGRRCFGLELSPVYCAVILERMEAAGCTCNQLSE